MTTDLVVPVEELCPCCDFGNHTETCTCDGFECCHPQKHFRGNKPDRSTFPELAGPHEVAAILGVSKQRAFVLLQRPGAPQPVAVLASASVYLAAEVEDYQNSRNKQRGRPRNNVHE